MRHRRISRRRLQSRLIGHSRSYRLLQRIVDLQHDPLRAVLAVFLLILALHNGERLQNVIYVVAGNVVEVEIGGIKLAAQQETTLLIPT